jgi:RNA polymerase sigma factor (sigma-70 family)
MTTTANTLVEQHIPWANKLAHRKKKTLPKFIDLEEIKSAAYMGLVEAASRYNPELNVEFTTFSYQRIWGAIHDYLREQGWMKRGEYQQMLSLDLDTAHNDGETCTLGDLVEAKPESDTEESFEVITLKMDNQAKSVLKHYFVDEYSMKEVGQKFGVSESRVSQLIKLYKKQIRSAWAEDALRSELAA